MQCDVLIIGSGVAGLSVAIKLAEANAEMHIVVLSKTALGETNTAYAQGGIAAVMDKDKDNNKLHFLDTMKSGGGMSSATAAILLSTETPNRIEELMQWGAEFDKTADGLLELGLEGGHSRNRIVHHNDQTGLELMRTLQRRVVMCRNVVIKEGYTAISLIRNKKTKACTGARVYDAARKEICLFLASNTVLATGGCGQLFKYTSNPVGATGDGIALAHEIGTDISNMQFIQFHPTTLYEPGVGQNFLITEALRGKGAHILNSELERFLFKYDIRGELATRDIVSQAIFKEMQQSDSPHVWLDSRHLECSELEVEFPYVMAKLKSIGLNTALDLVPITPAAHYQCGGITTDLSGKTNIDGLFAIGECANNGLHGANRLASNSLAEGLVFSTHVCHAILERPCEKLLAPEPFRQFNAQNPSVEIQQEWKEKLKDTLSKGFFSNNNELDFHLCLCTLSTMNEEISLRFGGSLFQREFHLMCSAAQIILQQCAENEIHSSDNLTINTHI